MQEDRQTNRPGGAVKAISIRVPQATHTKMSVHCLSSGLSMNAYVLSLIDEDLGRRTGELKTMLEAILEDVFEEGNGRL
jgi:hypothetical protein